MPSPMMRVRAVDDRKHPLIDDEGRTVLGRYCGRDAQHNALPDGELVPCEAYYLRALACGDLEKVEA